MQCDETRELLLNFGWDEAERARIQRALGHAEECDRCRSAFLEYDEIRAALTAPAVETEPAGGWRAFAGRLAVQPGVRRRSWGRPVAAAAALLVVAALGLAVGWFWSPRTGPLPQAPLASSRPYDAGLGAANPGRMAYSSEEIEARTRAFQSISDVFDRQAGWIVVSERGSDVGLSGSPIGTRDGLLVLRLVMSQGSRVASQADLVIVPGETASVTIPFEKGQQLRYCIGTSKDEPSRVTVWVEVQQASRGGESQAALATELRARGGQVLPAGQIITSAGRYDLDVALSQAAGSRKGS